MAIIKQLDKRSGITYVYESASYWDKEKQQPRSKRKLIGRLNPETGEVEPTDGRGKRRSQQSRENPAKRGPVPVIRTERLFYGATYLGSAEKAPFSINGQEWNSQIARNIHSPEKI
jgi:hypothetical protein